MTVNYINDFISLSFDKNELMNESEEVNKMMKMTGVEATFLHIKEFRNLTEDAEIEKI